MTLISQYSGFSRATTHKYLKNKDDAFRKVLLQVKQQANDACYPIMEKDLECWQSINLITQVWLKPTFEEAHDQRIINDLKYYAQHVAEDIFKQARLDIEKMLFLLLTKAEQQKEISLTNLHMDIKALSTLLLTSLDGLRGDLEKEKLEQASQDTLRIFKLACR